jgi:uncharacterized repeat protein (TIGR02543 family)
MSLTLGQEGQSGENQPVLTLNSVTVGSGELFLYDGTALTNLTIEQNGEATIYGGTITNSATSGSYYASSCICVKIGGTIHSIEGGTFVQSGTRWTLYLEGRSGTSSSLIEKITGGYFEAANSYAVNCYGTINEISGGKFVTNGVAAALYVCYGGAIGTISGGEFLASLSKTNSCGLFVMTDSTSSYPTTIGEITGGTFEGYMGAWLCRDYYDGDNQEKWTLRVGKIDGSATFRGTYTGLLIQGGGEVVDEISGGEFEADGNGVSNYGIIHTISGGTFRAQRQYGLLNGATSKLQGTIDNITGGTFVGGTNDERGIGLANMSNVPIQSISKGTFIGLVCGIYNMGTVQALSDVACLGDSAGVYNAGTVGTIDGENSALIGEKGCGLYNVGTVSEIKDGDFYGKYYGATDRSEVDGETTYTGQISAITGGVFCGEEGYALNLLSSCAIEADLTADKGAVRLYGGAGLVEHEADCAQYPAGYGLSRGTEKTTVTMRVSQTMPYVTTTTVDAHYLTLPYTVTYYANGGTGSTVDSGSPYDVGDTVTTLANGFTAPAGKSFTGWNTAANGSGTPYQAGATFQITENTTLYAQWEDGVCTVTYHPNGGTGTMEDALSPYAYNSTVTVLGNTFTRSGYTFTGWNTAANGSGTPYRAGATFQITEDITLYAQWKSIGGTDSGGGTPGGGTEDGDSGGGGAGGGSGVVSTGTVTVPDETGVSDLLNTTAHLAYLVGVGGGLFGPDQDMTRAEVAVMFYRLLNDQDVPLTRTFSDVPDGQWYTTAVHTLASLGVLQGYGDGAFGPGDPVTRAQFTAIAMRFGTLDATGENLFSDVSEGDWFYPYVVGAIQSGWITGYPDGTFRPNATIARAEVVAITNRMLGRAADQAYIAAHGDSLTQFADVSPDHWAYDPIMEATHSHDYTRTDGVEHWDE